MEKKYYTAKDVAEITGFKICKAYDIIRQINCEIKELVKDKPVSEQPMILEARVLKSYFDKKMNF